MWYKIKWLHFTDGRDVLGFFWIILRVFVTLPYKVIYKKTGRRYVAQKPGFLKFFEMAVTYAIIYYAQYLRYSFVDPNDFVSFYGIVTQYNVLSFVACASTLSFLFTHKHYVKAMDLMGKADKGLKTLGYDFTYNYWFLLACSYAANIIFVPIMLNATERTWVKIMVDLVAFHHPVVIRFAVMSKPVMAMGMLYEHFLKLNRQLNKLLSDDTDNDCQLLLDNLERTIRMRTHYGNIEQSPEYVLDLTTLIHTDLVEATTELNKAFTFIILLNAATNITQVVLALLFIYAGNYKEVSPLELTISFTLYTLQMGALYLLAYLIGEESKNTLISLGHFNAYYLDKNLAIKKNTFLLQGHHHKIDLKVCSVIPLNLSIFGRQISICSTLFFIVLQFYKNSQS